tara:strand:- start:411 stop:593 length:183 start_codon:yes stop_codon:yes gene_type:complete
MFAATRYYSEKKSVKEKTTTEKVTEEELTLLAYYLNLIAEYVKTNTIATPKETPEKYKVN